MNLRYALFILVICVGVAVAQDKPTTNVHGYVFGDYFYKVSGDTSSKFTGQYASSLKSDQAFQLRRLYLFADQTLSENFATQFLLEGTDKSLDGGGRFGVYIKTAFVEWKEVFSMSNLQLGLIPTPSWVMVSEKTWGYRPVEKTVADFRGLGVATDVGVSLRGKLMSDGMLSYHVMVGNGTGQKPETNKFKKYYGAIDVKPVAGLTLEAYADYEPTVNTKDKTTFKGFASYQTADYTFGAEVVHQLQLSGAVAGNTRPFGFSLFAWAPIPGSSELKAYARFDFFNPNLNVDTLGFNENFMTFGLDYMPIPNVHFMPNVWINSYSNKGSGTNPNADVVGRMTFFFVYN